MIDNVLYINLDKRADRRLHMEKQLNNLGIPHERIQAMTPEDIENKEWWLKRYNFKTMSKNSANTLARVACLISHIKNKNISAVITTPRPIYKTDNEHLNNK